MKSMEFSSWLQALRVYTHPRVLGMLSWFRRALPADVDTSFWLREAGWTAPIGI